MILPPPLLQHVRDHRARAVHRAREVRVDADAPLACPSISSERVPHARRVAPPALFTRISIRPNVARARSAPSPATDDGVGDVARRPTQRRARGRAPCPPSPRPAPPFAPSRRCPRPPPPAPAPSPARGRARRPVTIGDFAVQLQLVEDAHHASAFLVAAAIAELRVAPLQRRLQALLLRHRVELRHHRRLPRDRVALRGHPLHRPRAHQLERHVHDALVRRQQVDVDQRHPRGEAVAPRRRAARPAPPSARGRCAPPRRRRSCRR